MITQTPKWHPYTPITLTALLLLLSSCYEPGIQLKITALTQELDSMRRTPEPAISYGYGQQYPHTYETDSNGRYRYWYNMPYSLRQEPIIEGQQSDTVRRLQ